MGYCADDDAIRHRKADASVAHRAEMRERGYRVYESKKRSLIGCRIVYLHDKCGTFVADADKHDRYCLALREI